MNRKYEFTGETKDWYGITLKRIRATTDFTLMSGIKVVKGDLGGWIEKEENLLHEGLSWVYDNAKVYGNAEVSGNAKVHEEAQVCGNAYVSGDAWVSGNAEVSGYARVYGNAQIFDDARVYGNAQVYGNANVYGNVLVFDDARVCGNAQVYGNANVYGNAHVYGNAIVCGDAKVEKLSDIIWFKNIWTSGRTFTYTRSNGKWKIGCFYGTSEELIKKAYADSEMSGKCYEIIVRAMEALYIVMADNNAKE